MKVRFNINNILLVFDLIILVLLSGTSYKVIYSDLVKLIYLPIIWHLPSILKKKTINKSSILLIMLLAMALLSALLNWGDSLSWYIEFALQLLSICLISRNYSFKQIGNVYIAIMTVIATISLIMYPIVLSTNITSHFPVMTSSHNASYSMIPLYTFGLSGTNRNNAIFWEPGIYATMLIYSMIIVLFMLQFESPVSKSKTLFKICLFLFLIELISTNSSAAVILLLLYIVLVSVLRVETSKLTIPRLIGSWALIISVVIFILNFDTIIHLLNLDDNYFVTRLASTDYLNSNKRTMYFIHDWHLIQDNFLFGYGIKQTNSLIAGGDTWTSLYMWIVFGLFGVQYTFYYIYGILNIKVNALARFVLMVMILFVLNKEPHCYNMISWLLLFNIYTLDWNASKTRKPELERL